MRAERRPAANPDPVVDLDPSPNLVGHGCRPLCDKSFNLHDRLKREGRHLLVQLGIRSLRGERNQS